MKYMMCMKRFLVAGMIFTGISPSVFAAGPNGTYAEVAYADWDGFDNGIHLGLSLGITSRLRLFVDYTDTDLELIRFGAGWNLLLGDGVRLEIGGSGQRFDFGGVDDRGYGIHAILGVAPVPELSLSGKIERVNLDDRSDDTVLGLDLDYRITANLSLYGAYDRYDSLNQDLMKVGLRVLF
jgi:hypothetical protein